MPTLWNHVHAQTPLSTDPGIDLARDLQRLAHSWAAMQEVLDRALDLTPEPGSAWRNDADYRERVGHLRRAAALELIPARLLHHDGSRTSEWGTHFAYDTVAEAQLIPVLVAEAVRDHAARVLDALISGEQRDAWSADPESATGTRARTGLTERCAFLADLLDAVP